MQVEDNPFINILFNFHHRLIEMKILIHFKIVRVLENVLVFYLIVFQSDLLELNEGYNHTH